MELNDDLKSFYAYMAVERGLSPRTAIEYCRDINRFAKQHPKPLVNAKPKHIRRWIVSLMEDGSNKPQSVHRKIAALKAFFKWLIREGRRNDNPVDAIEPPKAEKRLPKCMTTAEVGKILSVRIARRTPGLELRDRAMMEVMYGSGLRRAEVCGIDIEHIDRERRMMRVVGKGNKERSVFLGEPTIAAIDAYLATRPAAKPNDPLFLTARRARMTPRQLWVIFKQVREASGLTKHVTPHTMRHSFATHMHENGADIMTIKELLGHESVQTTQVYTNVSLAHQRKTYAETHPRARLSSLPTEDTEEEHIVGYLHNRAKKWSGGA